MMGGGVYQTSLSFPEDIIWNDKKVEAGESNVRNGKEDGPGRIQTFREQTCRQKPPHRATGTADFLCTFCLLWISVNHSRDVGTVSMDIVQPIYTGKETSNQMGFCHN